tara:strand:+ start:4672 stop:4833 length:162 start_codon:yes stop_codon:yes gene_type:complete
VGINELYCKNLIYERKIISIAENIINTSLEGLIYLKEIEKILDFLIKREKLKY